MILRSAQLCVCLVLACGCKPQDQRILVLGGSGSRSPLLDALLTETNAFTRIKAAAQDLPSDEWRNHAKGGRYNATRSGRASEIATDLMTGFPQRLTNMSAQELVANLKTFSYGDYGSFQDAAYYVYLIGNSMIVDEFGRRPHTELDPLRSLKDDKREIWNGDSGGLFTVADLVRDGLLSTRTNGQPDGAANRSPPIRSETNRTSGTAGSGR